MPTTRNKAEIRKGMELSFERREEERKGKKTLAFFVLKYVHFGSFGGEMVSKDSSLFLMGSFLNVTY